MTPSWQWPSTPRLLITDFDGTITKTDFYERVLAVYGSDPRVDGWDRYEQGELSHFQALAKIFSALPGNEQAVMQIARSTEIDSGFARGVQSLASAGWGVIVVSAGCQWYIERLFQELGLSLPVISNPGELSREYGLRMLEPVDSPYYDRETGIDKAAVVRAALERYQTVAFAGNGRADLEAARIVAPELRFATGWLAEQLSTLGETYQHFAAWSDVANRLAQRHE